jgi:hypothetical protein
LAYDMRQSTCVALSPVVPATERGLVEAMKFDIALVGSNRERAYAKYKAFATYTFSVSHGLEKTHAEVIFVDSSLEVIERKGRDVRAAARLALERLLTTGCDPFENSIFVQIPYRQAEYFSKFGSFLREFPSS